ncbi:MAG: phage holin family protein [Candidatus Rokuibacteriota bacterium]
MATVHRLPVPDTDPEGLFARLARLLKLEMELGIAEVRDLLVSIAIAIAVAVVAAIALISSFAVLLAAAFAPLFDAPWPHLLIGGGAILLVALAGLAWSVWRLRSFEMPRETLTSFEENWQWLGAQVKSRLTLR